ncbi:VOC family protein [Virgibacillus necropolis]|uniref:Glyoxalase n=1 Tax=Virgibacillus necropolis TaxID=163877 RepID=A0A221MHV8_9BACI|nr:VOC family protein [Virgibacillus necropolis]ASN07192.1 glyoxalase [Virgibacillus necropolis]
MTFHTEKVKHITHIHLKVANLERSLNFYQNILGFHVIEQQPKLAVLTAGGIKSLLTIEQLENAKPLDPRKTGLFHIAFLLPKRADLAKVLRHFIHTGYPVQGASDHLVSEALYIADPDGNGVEIYVDRDPDEWGWVGEEVEMSTLPLDANALMKEVAVDGWQGMPDGTIIGHIHLQVSDLASIEKFYTQGFGFEVVNHFGQQAVFLSSAGYHHHIGTNTWNSIGGSEPSDEETGLKSYTITVPTNERLEIVGRLQNLGERVNLDGEQYLVKDPSGNRIYF